MKAYTITEQGGNLGVGLFSSNEELMKAMKLITDRISVKYNIILVNDIIETDTDVLQGEHRFLTVENDADYIIKQAIHALVPEERFYEIRNAEFPDDPLYPEDKGDVIAWPDD